MEFTRVTTGHGEILVEVPDEREATVDAIERRAILANMKVVALMIARARNIVHEITYPGVHSARDLASIVAVHDRLLVLVLHCHLLNFSSNVKKEHPLARELFFL